MSAIQKFINSLFGQFVIGGATVAGITYFANQLNDTVLASIIAGVPIGMPSAIFVDDKKVIKYSKNLTIMTVGLLIATAASWILQDYYNYDKYQAVKASMGIWLGFGVLLYLYKKMTT